MGKIAQSTTLRTEDFDADQRKWLPRLFTPLNLFITTVTNAINGQIEFGANIPSQDVALDFTYTGMAQRFTWNGNVTPKILWVGQSYEADVAVALVPIWSYNATNSMISVDFINAHTGALTSGTRYKVFLRVVP